MIDNQTSFTSFIASFPVTTYQNKEVILAADTQTHIAHFLESGAVVMSSTNTEGRHLILHIFFPHSFFPLLTLPTNGQNKYDFTARGSVAVRKIPMDQLTSFLLQHPQLLFDLSIRLLQGMEGLLTRIKSLSNQPAKNQVLSLLEYFAVHFAQTSSAAPTSRRLSIKITHQEIADWLGLSRENVSLQMKQLERDGVLTTTGQFLELNQLPDDLT